MDVERVKNDSPQGLEAETQAVSFDFVTGMPFGEREEFFSLFTTWLTGDESFESSLETAPEHIKSAVTGVLHDEEGQVRPREMVVAGYTAFVQTQAERAEAGLNTLVTGIKQP